MAVEELFFFEQRMFLHVNSLHGKGQTSIGPCSSGAETDTGSPLVIYAELFWKMV